MTDKLDRKAEELSTLIDALNNKEQVSVKDREMQELLELASMLKSNDTHEGHTFAMKQTVDMLAQDAIQRKKRVWMRSLAGAAAAVLLVVSAQTSSWFNQEPKQIVLKDNYEAVEISPAKSIDLGLQGAKNGSREYAEAGYTTPQNTLPQPKAVVRDISVPEYEEKVNDVQTIEKNTAQEDIKHPTSVKTPVVAMLVLPGEQAEMVSIDNDQKTVRQVYHQGTSDEIIVTTRAVSQAMVQSSNPITNNNVRRSMSPQVMKTETNQPNNNIVKINIRGYEVTVEGQKTQDELLKIAQALTVKEEKK